MESSQETEDTAVRKLEENRATVGLESEAESWELRGAELRASGDLSTAIEAYRRAIDLRQELGHIRYLALDHNRLGIVFRQRGELETAEELFNEAFRLSSHGGWRQGMAAARHNLARVALDRGELEGARVGFQEALIILEDLSEEQKESELVRRDTSLFLQNLARLMMVMGEQEEARSLLERALEIRRDLPTPKGLAGPLADLGWLYLLEDRHQKALAFLDLALTQAAGKPGWEVVIQDRRGAALEAMGRIDDAYRAYQGAEERANSLGDQWGVMGIHANICRLDVENEKSWDKKDDPCGRAVQLSRELGGRPNVRSWVLYWAARRLQQRGELEQAADLMIEATELMERLRGELGAGPRREKFFTDRESLHRFAIELLMERHLSDPEGGWGDSAFELGERLRARSLLDLLVAAEVDFFASASPELRAKWDELNAELHDLQKALASRSPQEATHILEQRLDHTLAELDQLELELWGRSPWYLDALQSGPSHLAAVQRHLDEETVLLSVLQGETKSFLWVVSRHRLKSFILTVPRDELTRSAQEFTSLLGDARKARKTARWLYWGNLLRSAIFPSEKLFNELAGLRLVFVGDGALRDLPLSALPLEGSTPEKLRFLVEQNAVVHLPSASTLVTLRTLSRQRPAAPNTAILLGDPVYLAEERSAATLSLRLEPFPQESLEHYFPQMRPSFEVGRLPFTLQEVNSLQRIFGERRVEVAVGPEASRHRLLAPEMRLYRIIHIASHGWIDLERPSLSALVLSEVNSEGERVDGHLRVRDFVRLRWNAELVVASACQTALGKPRYAEGVTGLARGILGAGAQRAIVSLWPVESQSTALLMERFYHDLVADGLDPAEALRQARLVLLRGEEGVGGTWTTPNFWAGFIFIGDWRSFHLP